MNTPEQTFDAHFDAGKAIQNKSGYSLMRIEVFAPRWEMEPTIQFWLFSPDGEKIGQIDGKENEAIAAAALAGIENHYKETEQ